MWAAARPALLALLPLLLTAPALAVRSAGGGAAIGDLNADSGAAAEAEAEVGSASGSGLQAGSLMLDRYMLMSLLDATAWPATGLKGYTKLGYLGKGAFGETWLARDTEDGKEVAVKFFYRAGKYGAVTLLNMRNADWQEKEQLRTAGAECDLPGSIIKAKSTPEGENRFALCLANKVSDRDYAHLVLQVAGTEDLEQYVKRKRSLPADVVKRVAKMILEGLVQMEGKYVHRDIKPANLMVYTEGGQVYLRFIDFGLVVREGSGGGVAGTPMFMPPEMWPVVPRSPTFKSSFDVYSAGETLYWLICGKTFHEKIFDSYGGRGEREIKRALDSTDPKRLCSPPSALTGLYSVVVDGMLKASAAQRSKASVLLSQSVFQDIDTSKPGAAEEQVTPQQLEPPGRGGKPGHGVDDNKKPNRPAEGKEPFEDLVKEPVEVPQEPSFLDKCHDDKGFWFANVHKCCLTEKYDPKRDAVCNRPCGPKVGYSNGMCANACQPTSTGQFEFSRKKFCCVARVWMDKCIYPDYIPSGEGWRWMAAENL